MSGKFEEILSTLPEKPMRSRLEPYRELIEELRRRRRTFAEIAEILTVKCGVKVTGSGVHDFVRRRTSKRRSRPAEAPRVVGQNQAQVDRRIADLKKPRTTPTLDPRDSFHFDPDKPLTCLLYTSPSPRD